MTNSYRRQPFAPYCGGSGRSQKKDKRIGNRRMRRVNRVLMQTDQEAVFRSKDEMQNPYDWVQDGTRRYQPFDARIPYRDWFRWAKAK